MISVNLEQALQILKDAKVSHTIYLSHNQIEDQGVGALAFMIEHAKFPTYIDLGSNNLLEKVMTGNAAILAIRNHEKFKLNIENIFKLPLPILNSKSNSNSKLNNDVLNNIVGYIEQQETNNINLQYLQDYRIKEVQKLTGKDITPATANYATKVKKFIDDVARIDKLSTTMLLIENMGYLLPKEVKNGISEYAGFDVKYIQYVAEGGLGISASYLGYISGYTTWAMPIKRVGVFYSKEVMEYTAIANLKSAEEMIDNYTYGYIGEKEQKLIFEIIFGVGIGILSPAPMMTIGVMGLGAARSYLDIEENNIGKIAGGLLGVAGAYYGDIGTYYQYAASMIGGAYTGDMLSGVLSVTGYGVDYIINSPLDYT